MVNSMLCIAFLLLQCACPAAGLRLNQQTLAWRVKELPQFAISALKAPEVQKAQELWTKEINECKNAAKGVSTFKLFDQKALHEAEAEQNADALSEQGPFDEFSDLPESVWEQLKPDLEAMSHVTTLPILPKSWDMMRVSKTSTELSENDVAKAKDLFTTGSCKLTAGSQVKDTPLHTCEFHNLYIEQRGFMAHVLENTEFPPENTTVRIGIAGTGQLRDQIKVVSHKSPEDFAKYLQAWQEAQPGQTQTVQELSGTTLAFHPQWHFNFGHAFYDSMYPGFVSLIQWGRDQENWRSLLLMPDQVPGNVEAKVPGAYGRIEQLMGGVSGLGSVRWGKLKSEAANGMKRIETLILGVGWNRQKLDMNSGFSLGAGRELNAASLFRKKVYASLSLPEPSRVPRRKELQGIIIHNKRFGNQDPAPWAAELIEKAAEQGVRLEYINWGKLTAEDEHRGGANQATKENPSPQLDTFRKHVDTVRNADIHISGPGTGMMYQHFLSDGAVHINLVNGGGAKFPNYMEEYMAEGAPYYKALYYWNQAPALNNKTKWPWGNSEQIRVEDMMRLVVQAKQLIADGFELPVPVGANLSPLAQVFKGYFYLTQDPDDIAQLTPIHSQRLAKGWNPRYFSYTAGCGTKFPHEMIMNKNAPTCHFDPCLMKKLMENYGPPCPGCAWPSLE